MKISLGHAAIVGAAISLGGVSAANSQLTAVTNALPSIANPCGPGEGYGTASYQNFLNNPGYYENVALKYCYVPQ